MPNSFEWIHPGLASSWLETIVLGTLKASIPLGAAGLAAVLLRTASSATRHIIWALALLASLAVPFASRVLPAWAIAWAPARTWLWSSSQPWSDAVVPARTVTGAAARNESSVIRPPAHGEQRMPATNVRITIPATAAASERRARTSALRARWDAGMNRLIALTRAPQTTLVALVWLMGVIVLSTRRAVASWRVGRLARRSTLVTDPSWRSLLAASSTHVQVGRAVSLRMSRDVRVPMTWGTWSPVVLLPEDASRWPAPRRRVVLLHELAHVRRLDTLTTALAQMACAIHWFNPLVWVAAASMRKEAEHACDDEVLNAGARASAYAGDLLDIARHAGADDRLATAALAMARPSQLEGRLLAILDARRARGAAGRAALVCATMTTIVVTVALGAARPDEEPGLPAVKPVEAVPVKSAAPPVAPVPPAAVAPRAAAPAPPAVTATAPPVARESVPPVASVPATPASPALVANTDGKSARHQSSWSINDASGRSTWRGGWSDEHGSAKIRAEGDIRFNRDGTDVESISDNGYFRLEVTRDGHTRRVEIEARDQGLERAMYVDGKQRPWDAEARAWFAGALVDLDRATAILLDRRFPSLMSQGGPSRVLDEITKITSDYAKGRYFDRLLDAKLDRPTMRRAIAQAGKEIESDYELARVLSKAVERNALDDPEAHGPFLGAVDGIESDYEHARVLMMIVSRKDMTAAEASTALRSSTRLSSDYERSRVLTALAERGPLGPDGVRAYIESASKMSSDYERGRSLGALLDHQPMNEANVLPLLKAAETMSSDYERANLLVRIVEHTTLGGRERDAYRNAARGISSEYERNRALAALGEKGGD